MIDQMPTGNGGQEEKKQIKQKIQVFVFCL